MPKLPYMKFYPADYLLATRPLTDTEQAVWVDLLCYMWLKPEKRGFLEMNIDDMARMVGRERLTLQITLDSLKKKGICVLEERANQVVFVECRRMVRDAKELIKNKNRQKRYNAFNNASYNASYNASNNAKITPKKSEVRSQKEKEEEKEEKESAQASPAPHTLAFQRPTVDQVAAYCQERNNSVDALRFFDYYQANGWRVGRNPMKDWRAAVRTWERQGRDSNPKGGEAWLQTTLDPKN